MYETILRALATTEATEVGETPWLDQVVQVVEQRSVGR
jgi:hypothetical protein